MCYRRILVAMSLFPLNVYRKILRSSGQYKYLHSAVIISGLMLVFGGNTHNDTSMSYGAKCYSADFLAYDMCEYLISLRLVNKRVGFSLGWLMAVLINNYIQ